VLATFTAPADANGPASLCSALPVLAASAAVWLAPEAPPALAVLSPAAGLAFTPLAPLSIAALLSGGTGDWRALGTLAALNEAVFATPATASRGAASVSRSSLTRGGGMIRPGH
jgi:hypothetical protein